MSIWLIIYSYLLSVKIKVRNRWYIAKAALKISLNWWAGPQVTVSSVQSLSCVQLFATPWTAACQASLSITNSQSLPKLVSIESAMPSKHLTLFLCLQSFSASGSFPMSSSHQVAKVLEFQLQH